MSTWGLPTDAPSLFLEGLAVAVAVAEALADATIRCGAAIHDEKVVPLLRGGRRDEAEVAGAAARRILRVRLVRWRLHNLQLWL